MNMRIFLLAKNFLMLKGNSQAALSGTVPMLITYAWFIMLVLNKVFSMQALASAKPKPVRAEMG